MLSCIIRPSEACSKIEIRSIEVVVDSKNQIRSALQARGTLSQAVTKKQNIASMDLALRTGSARMVQTLLDGKMVRGSSLQLTGFCPELFWVMYCRIRW